jgi:HlyD family secretion protein
MELRILDDVSQPTRLSIHRHVLAVGISLGTLLIGVGGWAATTEFSGAVVAHGSLVVESDVKKVQHPTGGVISELRVRDGDRVAAGDVLVRLDETVTQANLAVVLKALNEALAQQARLESERDGATDVSFPRELSTAAEGSPEVAALLGGERRLFELRVSARSGLKSQHLERIGQMREQIRAYSEQIVAKDREAALIAQELEGVRDLYSKKLVSITRLNALERDAARITGEKGTLISAVAQAKGKITETELQILQIDEDLRTEVGKVLADLRGKISELVERKVTAEDQLKRVDIRAPQSGTVHQLAVHTIGGVASPGETLMLIVPGSDRLTVQARVRPQDIEQVYSGQRAALRFSALNHRTTPEIEGEVSRVSPDLTVDQRTGQDFYTLRVAILDGELARLQGAKIGPGMPVEVFVRTQQRTVLSYFTKPLSDQIARAFRER